MAVPALCAAAACAAGNHDRNAQRSSSRAAGDDAGAPAGCVRVTDIGTFSGTLHGAVQVTDINERGEAVGYVLDANGFRAFYWNGSQLVDLGEGSQAFSINERSEIALNVGGKAYIWRNGTTEELTGLGAATAINDAGDVVGRILPIEYGTHAAIWRDGTLTDLGVINGDFSVGVGLNERGQVLVDSGNDVPIQFAGWHPFLWDRGTATDVNPPTEQRSHAVALSESGSALVNALVDAGINGFPDQAFLWSAGTSTSVKPLGTDFATGTALNDQNAVVGNAYALFADHVETHAFFWQNGQSTFITVPGITADDPGTPVRVDNRGVVAVNATGHAFAWQNGASVALEGGAVQQAMTMNQHGLIAGTISSADFDVRTARIWDTSRCFEAGDAGSAEPPDAGDAGRPEPPPVDAGTNDGGGKTW
jgi:probable HAF family extracellular repeat protein